MGGSTYRFNWCDGSSEDNNIVKNLLFNYCANNIKCDNDLVRVAIADSGCSDHYASINTDVSNIRPSNNKITASLPNGDLISSTHAADLNLTKLPVAARKCHLFPAMKNKALLSLGKLYDHNMEVHLTKENIIITEEKNKNNIVLTGKRNIKNGMWYVL